MDSSAELLPTDIRDRAVDLLTELCAISSASGDVVGVKAVADRLAAELSRRGLAIETRMEPDGQGGTQPLLLARGPDAGDRYLLVVSHLDTVLPASPPRRGDGRLLAAGALDTKGGLAALVAALDLLAARGARPPADVLLLAVPDEEANGAISERALAEWGSRARTLLVLEPGEARGDGETLVAGRRGLTEWRLDARGRAAHSGLAYWDGRSALAAAAEWCARAQGLSRPGAGVTVNAARLIAGDTDFVDSLAANHDLLGSSRRRNVVAERAVAEGEVRYLAEGPGDDVLARLADLARGIAAESGVELVFATGQRVPPVDPRGAGEALVRRTVELARTRGWRLEVEEDRGGISFPNYVTGVSRIPTVDGLGPVGGGMHTREEFVDLRSLERRAVLLADLLETL